jgi:hypothetical protein
MAQKEPTPLQDAIRAQRAVVDQLADEHAEAHAAMAAKGEQLMQAHATLDKLLTQKAAE